MHFTTRSGARYVAEPQDRVVFVNDGVSEVFDLTVTRADDEPLAPSGMFFDCIWLKPIVEGEHAIFAYEAGGAHYSIETTTVVSIGA